MQDQNQNRIHIEALRLQLIDDFDWLYDLILQADRGDRSAKRKRDQLQGAVDVKLAILEGMERESP